MENSPLADFYIHGHTGYGDVWYRVTLTKDHIFDATNKRKRTSLLSSCRPKGPEIYPVAKMFDEHGLGGSWEVIGDFIYSVGGYRSIAAKAEVNQNLLKHDMNDDDPSKWVPESSCMKMPRKAPFFAAVKNQQQLCVVSGQQCPPSRFPLKLLDNHYNEFNQRYEKCGEVYNIVDKTWNTLGVDYYAVSRYCVVSQVALVENDDCGPTQVVFYNLLEGSTLFLDVTTSGGGTGTGTLKEPQRHKDFALWKFELCGRLPQGLKNYDDVDTLQHITHNRRAVFANNTFYWFSPLKCLYGYDIEAQTWLRSPSLENQFPPSLVNCPRCPILLFLGKNKFIVSFDAHHGKLTLAFLTVDKRGNSLSVSVQLVQPFTFHDRSFVPVDGKAILLNNTG